MTNFDQITRAPQGSFKLQRKLLAATVAACFGVAQANPTLPQVVAGQATFAQQGNVFSITNTPNTIINWQSFSVGRDEITRFIQQSSDSKVLNRITGQDPSQILGSLQSNGQVFLINPNGVLFGKDARIDVNGLVASSLQLSNSDFLAGKHNFNGAAGAGKVVNQGSITTPQGGKVFLIAPTVENHGVISAPNGEILLAAGKSVQLVDSANPAITVVVSAPEDQVLNLGQIVAQGGRVGIYGALVNQRGVVNANSAVRGENGKIVLKASRDTVLAAGSQTTASGAGKGGEIQVLGQNVALNGNALVDASGREGGGTVLVGGDYQGKNSAVQNARQAFIGKNAVIRADAEASGDGGKVIVWADEATRAYGAISARSAGGKGGFVETSGHYLDVAGLRVDTTGLDATGVWLLDPYNIEVVSSSYGAYGLADVADFSGGLPSPATTQILASTINSATSNVVLQATNNITVSTDVSMTAAGKSFSAYAGNDINVNANLQTNGGAIGLYANYAPSGSASGSGAVRLASNKTIGSGAADITLSGIGVVLNGAVTATPGGARVGDNAPLISLRANSLDIAATGSVTNSAGDGGYVSITPFTSTYNMSIMGADSTSSGTMVLEASDLARVDAYELALGGASVGELSIYAPLDLHANLVVDAQNSINHSGAIDANGHSVLFNVYNASGAIDGNYGTFTEVDTLRLRANNFNYSGVANSIAANKVYIDKQDLSAAISLGGTNPAGAYLSESELKMFDAPLIYVGTTAGFAGAIQITENLDLSDSNAGKTNGATAGQLMLQGSSVHLGSNVKAAGGVKIVATGDVTQGGALQAERLTVSTPTGQIQMGQFGNAIGTINLDGRNIIYTSSAATTVEGLRQRDVNAAATVQLSGGAALSVLNANADGGLILNADSVNLLNGGVVQGKEVNVTASQMSIAGTGSLHGTERVWIDAQNSLTLGGTATAVEGGMLLNAATLSKITAPELNFATDNGGDIHLRDTALSAGAYVGADGTLYGHGNITAAGLTLQARKFDLSDLGTVNTGSNNLLLSTWNTNGQFHVSATADPAYTSVTGADLNKLVTANLILSGHGGVKVNDVITRSGTGNLTLSAMEGTIDIGANVTVGGTLGLNTSKLNVAAAAFGNTVSVSATDLDIVGAGALGAANYLSINAVHDARIGGTLNAVEGGMALTSDELGKINANAIYVSANSYGGDITLDTLSLGSKQLSARAAGTLTNLGNVSAQNLYLSATEYDLNRAGTSLAGVGVNGRISFGSSSANGVLQLNGSSSSNAVFDTAALSKVTSAQIAFDGNNGVLVNGPVSHAGGNLSFLSGSGTVDFQSAVDVGSGQIIVQSNTMNIGATLTASAVSLAPLTGYEQYRNIVIGDSCGAVTDCVRIGSLANVNAAQVVVGAGYNTGTLTVGDLSASKRHANTTAITLRAKNGVSQTGAIDVGTLWVGTTGSTVLSHAGNKVDKLGADNNGGMTTQNLTFNNSQSLIYEGGNVSGTVDLTVNGNLTSGLYKLAADRLRARVTGSVGGSDGTLWTVVKKLDVETTAATGKSSINITNNAPTSLPGALTIERMVVADTNTGAITLNNYGATTVASSADTKGTVHTGSGAISITAHSPLTIAGKVASVSGAVSLEAGASASPANDVLTISGTNARVQTGGVVNLIARGAVNADAGLVSGSTVTTTVNGVVVTPPVSPPPVDPPPVNPPPVNPPPVNPPPVDPPPVNPPPVNPPPVDPPPVNPPPVNPPPVDPPPVNPPPVNPPPVNPPPTADICTIAPNSALCQVLTPPTASEPVKPVDRAVTQVINVINAAQEDTKPASSSSGSSGSTGKASGPVNADTKEEKKEDAKEEKKDDKSAQTGNKETKNEKPAAKSYCN